MAHLLGAQSLSVPAGSRKPLEEVTPGVEDSSGIGILRPNGAGKPALLCLITGLQEPDGDQITRREGITVLVLDQADHLDLNLWVVGAVHPGPDEYEWTSDPVIRDIHAGLLANIRPGAGVGTFSGGQRRRVVPAKALAAPLNIVCLDEPTNHLDIEDVVWLIAHLNARFVRAGTADALLVVTHDRWFFDTVCKYIWEIAPGIGPGGDRLQIPGHVDVYEGSYTTYTLVRAERVG